MIAHYTSYVACFSKADVKSSQITILHFRFRVEILWTHILLNQIASVKAFQFPIQGLSPVFSHFWRVSELPQFRIMYVANSEWFQVTAVEDIPSPAQGESIPKVRTVRMFH